MSQTAEQLKTNEARENSNHKPSQEQKAAFQEVTGDYAAVFKMGDYDRMVQVRPLTESKISEIFGAMSLHTEEKEKAVSGELALSDPSDDEELIERGKIAKEQVLQTASALKGQVPLANALREQVTSGLTKKQSEIFVLEGGAAKYIFDAKQAELKGPNLNVSPIYDDITNLGSQYALVMTPKLGAEFKNIFLNNNHRVKDLPSGKGFQAEIGNLNLAFLYPDKVKTVRDGKEEMVSIENEQKENDEDNEGELVEGRFGKIDETEPLKKAA